MPKGRDVFDGPAALQYEPQPADGATPERVIGAKVTANYFDVMGTAPLVGRVFTPSEDQPGADRVAVISYRLWQRRFGGAPLVGRDIRLNATSYMVIGIMPAAFDLTNGTEELWTPIAFTPERRRMHDEHYLSVYGRLKHDVAPQRAMAQLDAVAARISRDFASELVATGVKFSMMPFHQQFVGDYRARLFLLMAAVAVVLLIACVNVANLLLARGSARAREIAIRTAIGAGRWRIVRQLLTESVVLGIVAAGAGVLLAHTMLRGVVAWSPPDIPRLDQARVDPHWFAASQRSRAVSSAVSPPRPGASRAGSMIHGGRRDHRGGRRDRLRAGLITAEVALAIVLLTGAGLLIRSAIALQQVDPGFDPVGVFTARFTLPEQTYTDPVREAETLRRFGEAAQQLPGVTAAAVSSYAAMGSGGGTNGLIPEGADGHDRSHFIQSILRVTTADFFPAMRTPIIKGRTFTDDDRATGQRVMIINQTLAARAFPGQDPIGRRIPCCEATADGGPA
jgi:predicted permease